MHHKISMNYHLCTFREYIDHVRKICLPAQDDTIIIEACYFFTVLMLTIITFIPTYIIVCRYLKRHSITGDINCSKAVARLALFLVTGNLINSTSSTVTSIIAYFTAGSGAVPLIHCVFIIGLLSLCDNLCQSAEILLVTWNLRLVCEHQPLRL